MKLFKAKVISQKSYGCEYFLLTLKSNAALGEIVPGTFVMLSFPDRIDPLLPRPMGIFQVLQEEQDSTVFTIGYFVLGKGTALLSKIKEGDYLTCTGPFGNGWSLDEIKGSALLVAGGIGITSFYLAAKRLIDKKVETVLLYGARTSSNLVFIDHFEKLGLKIIIYTEDGSTGEKGIISSAFDKFLTQGTSVLACGPNGMLKKVSEICMNCGIDPQLSIDRRMACGFGVCLGCNIAVKSKTVGTIKYVRVCKEGPVFMGSEVVW